MGRIFSGLIPVLRKSISFGLAAALGCAIGAGAGEMVLTVSAVPAPPQPHFATCLLIDTSGSMEGDKLDEVKKAATDYVRRQKFDQGFVKVALVSFDSEARTVVELTNDPIDLARGCSSLAATGETALDLGLREATQALTSADAKEVKSIILFTDGDPNNQEAAVASAKLARDNNIQIVAIKTGDAKTDNLAAIASVESLVFPTTAGSFGKAFETAENVMNPQKTIVDESEGSWLYEATRFGAYCAVLALAIGVALVVSQNVYLRKSFIQFAQLPVVVLGSLAAGFGGGFVASIYFSGTKQVGEFVTSVSKHGIPSIAIGVLLGYIVMSFLPRGEVGWSFKKRSLIAIVFAVGLVLLDWSAGFTVGSWLVDKVTSPSAQRPIGWAVLGALLGWGMSLFIPNLKMDRATIGGCIGGIAGGVAFVLVEKVIPGLYARLAGAAALGFCIGLMVAFVEAAFREFWLDVSYGKGESRIINLGSEPVSIGSAQGSVTVYAYNAPPLAYRYYTEQGNVVCEDGTTKKITTVAVGDRKAAGVATITVCSGRKGTTATAPPKAITKNDVKIRLQISGSRLFPLSAGLQLMPTDLPGLEPRPGGPHVAEVVRNPQDPSVLGLMNTSHRSWQATPVGGAQKSVEPGRSVKLVAGTKINFGPFTGELKE